MKMSRIIKTTKLWPTLLATACSLFLLPALASAAPRGDVNQDGEFDIIDIQVVVNKVIDGIENDALVASYLADVDCDEEFDVVDIQLTVGLALAASGEPGIPLVNDTDGDLIHNNCEGVDPGLEEATLSCEDCSLQLRRVNKEVVDGRIREVKIAVEYNPTQQDIDTNRTFRSMDLRIVAPEGVTLSSVEPGDWLGTENKYLFVDPMSGNPWQEREGAYRFLFLSGNSQLVSSAGSMMTLTFTADSEDALHFNIEKRSELAAPGSANSIIQGTSYETPLMVNSDG